VGHILSTRAEQLRFFDHFVLVCGKCEYDAVVRDGDPVGIAAKIVKDLFGAGERFFERFWCSFMLLGALVLQFISDFIRHCSLMRKLQN